MTTIQQPHQHWDMPPRSRKKQNWFVGLKRWQQIGLVLAVLFAFCTIGAALGGGNDPTTPASQPVASASVPSGENGLGAAPTTTAPQVAEVPPVKPVKVTGSGNSVAKIAAPLTGGYRVDYSFGSWCGIVKFMKADGSSGAGFMDDINECSGDPNNKMAGSTIVHLDDVSMVQVENTRGKWSLTFTPIG